MHRTNTLPAAPRLATTHRLPACSLSPLCPLLPTSVLSASLDSSDRLARCRFSVVEHASPLASPRLCCAACPRPCAPSARSAGAHTPRGGGTLPTTRLATLILLTRIIDVKCLHRIRSDHQRQPLLFSPTHIGCYPLLVTQTLKALCAQLWLDRRQCRWLGSGFARSPLVNTTRCDCDVEIDVCVRAMVVCV